MGLITSSSRRLVAAGISVAMAVMLSACGGGGASTPAPTPTPTPTTVTVTCPNGSTQTAATTDLANAACPAPALVSVSPANGSAAVSVDAFASVDVVTDSTLDASSITSTNVTLKAGSNAIAGTASAVGTKSLKFAPAAKLNYAQAYSFSATVKDTLGKALTVSSTFTTAAIACTAPQVPAADGQSCVTPVAVCTAPAVWTAGINACVTPMGTQVIGMNQLPVASLTIGDVAWREAVTDGTVKFLSTGIVLAGYSARPIVWAFYKGPITGNSCTRLIYKDDGTGVANTSTEGNCNTDIPVVDWAVGTSIGVVRHFPGPNKCYQLSWNQVRQGLDDVLVTCPF